MAWGLREALGGGVGKAEGASAVMVPMKAPMAAPWAALVVVTTAASTARDCLESQSLKPVSNSLKRAWNWCKGFWVSDATIIPCFPCSIQGYARLFRFDFDNVCLIFHHHLLTPFILHIKITTMLLSANPFLPSH